MIGFPRLVFAMALASSLALASPQPDPVMIDAEPLSTEVYDQVDNTSWKPPSDIPPPPSTFPSPRPKHSSDTHIPSPSKKQDAPAGMSQDEAIANAYLATLTPQDSQKIIEFFRELKRQLDAKASKKPSK